MNNLIFSPIELALHKKYLDQGFLIVDVESYKRLDNIRDVILSLLEIEIDDKQSKDKSNILNNYHSLKTNKRLNDTRLDIIKGFKKNKQFRVDLFNVVKNKILDLVGNELVMQKNVNLSIQLPGDQSSLLDIHADTWGGNSPFELVVWLPLVDCYNSKSMYILPKTEYNVFEKQLSSVQNPDSEMIYQMCKKKIIFIKIKYGQVLLFNPMLPHGNRINLENETRWSLNFRFKNIFSPYGDKKLGEYYEPIIIRPCTQNGLDYKHPNL